MPFYDYEPAHSGEGCAYCRNGFEIMQRMNDERIANCPQCGTPVKRRICAPAIVRSKSKLDDRAKAAGFTKLKKVGKGEYEKIY